MELNILLVLDYQEICRLCLKNRGAMSNIFEKLNDLEEETLREQIVQITGTECEENDGLPFIICHKCRYIVETAYELRLTVAKSQKLLLMAAQTCKADKLDVAEAQTPQVNNGTVNKDDETEVTFDTELCANSSITEISQADNPLEETIGLDSKQEDSLDINKPISNPTKCKTRERNSKRADVTYQQIVKLFNCKICLRKVPTSQNFIHHVECHYVHSKLMPYIKMIKPYYCDICNQFCSREVLIEHHRRHLGVNPFVCKELGCSFVGTDKASFRNHKLVHTSVKFTCSECGAHFKRRWTLTSHLARRHAPHDSEGRVCAVCGLLSKNHAAHLVHVATHTKQHRHVCPTEGCTKRFRSKAELETHKRSHEELRSFKCTLCPASYTSKHQLVRHSRLHEQKRVWFCAQCDETYLDYGVYYSHRALQHAARRTLRCSHCLYNYKSQEHLEKHQEKCKAKFEPLNENTLH